MSTYAGEWSKTTNGGSASLTNKVYKLPSGTYRVKTVFTVTADGSTETITVYSDKKTWTNIGDIPFKGKILLFLKGT